MRTYEIEINGDYDPPTVRILSDDDDILADEAAMAAVGRAVIRAFGVRATTRGRGCAYFHHGREAGWEWDVMRED